LLSPLNARAEEDSPQSLQKLCDAKSWNACNSPATSLIGGAAPH
jgi:hypothetical protein